MVSPELLYSGPELGVPTGAFYGVHETIALEHLGLALPMPIPVDDGHLAFSGSELGK